jgi:tetratricopeptide (TPR) repeat protein
LAFFSRAYFSQAGPISNKGQVLIRGAGRCVTVARMRLALSALAIALTIAGCSSYAMLNKSASARAEQIKHASRAYKIAVAHPQSGIHRYHSLEATPLAPNCELTGQEPDTVDTDLWARLKLDYERHCYKQAETFVRKRLQQLLASGRRGPPASAPIPSIAPVPIAAPESADVVDVPPLSPTDASAQDTSEGVAASVKDAEFYYAQGVAAYHDGDVVRAIVDFSLATGRDPNFKKAYIDQGIAWYRMGNFNRAFADITQVMRIENFGTNPTLPKTSPLSNQN